MNGSVLEGDDSKWVCVPPPRCPATRRRTLGDLLLVWFLHYDVADATQCNHYMGHEFFEALSPDLRWHECPRGKRWL